MPVAHLLDLSAPRATPIPVQIYGVTPSTPASALADRIFNDPQSWNSQSSLGLSKDELAAWEEIDQFPAVPSGPDSADFMLKPFTNKFRLVRPDLMSPESELEFDTYLEGINDSEKAASDVPLITIDFEYTRRKQRRLSQLDRMSVLWAHGNLFRAFPSPLSVPSSPLSSSAATQSFHSPLLRPRTAVPCPPLHTAPSTPRLAAQTPSPVRTGNSAMWSILEYYGVGPDTPRTTGRERAVSASAVRFQLPAHPAVSPPPVPTVPTAVPATAGQRRSANPAPAQSLTMLVPPPPIIQEAPPPKRTAPRASGEPLPLSQRQTPQAQTPTQARPQTHTRPRPLPSIPQHPPAPAPQPFLKLEPLRRPRANTTGIRSLPPTPPSKDKRRQGRQIASVG
ncbi:hypothetical protein C8J57DRAFT_1732859 [Mycena rebaudengoi]|nr:hypothetical protein C8J57DRAFT_1732859 [Mycena rebaudengoi]